MCGRYVITLFGDIRRRFQVDAADREVRLPPAIPRFNIAPSQEVPAIVQTREGRQLWDMRWGFQPDWATPQPGRPPPINARAETLLERGLFRDALAAGRCIIPADGFYEWQAIPGARKKQPMFIRLKDGGLFGFAGLWAVCRNKTGETIRTCAIVTTAPNDLMQPIHNRMPVILAPEDEALWLDRAMTDSGAVMACLRPYPPDLMETWPVGTLVNSADNDGPELLARLAG